MSALPDDTVAMSESEYLAFERVNETKHEFVDGEVFAMTGASENHNLICLNLFRVLGNQLLEGPCKVYPSDMRVKVEATRLYTYPDVSVVCDDPQFADNEFDTLLNPLVIIEVLSPSTDGYDRGRKFQNYRLMSTLQEYLLVSQDTARIEHYIRQENGEWLLSDVIGLDGQLKLPSIECSLLMSDVYRKVTFEVEDDKDK
jgi:Uma2 family endonuclease